MAEEEESYEEESYEEVSDGGDVYEESGGSSDSFTELRTNHGDRACRNRRPSLWLDLCSFWLRFHRCLE